MSPRRRWPTANCGASEEKLLNAQKDAQGSGASVQAAQARTEVARAALAQARANRRQVDISSAQAGIGVGGDPAGARQSRRGASCN